MATKTVKKSTGKKAPAKVGVFGRLLNTISRRPKTSLLVGVLIVVLLVGLVPQVRHTFGAGCSGNLIDSYTIRRPSDGASAGTFKLYYGSGHNCGIAYAGGVTGGSYMNRHACLGINGTWRCDGPGWWYSYAGPVNSVYSAGKCVDIDVSFYRNTGYMQGRLYKSNVHCG